MAEAIGAWCAIDMGRQLELTHVKLEGDSLEVIQALR